MIKKGFIGQEELGRGIYNLIDRAALSGPTASAVAAASKKLMSAGDMSVGQAVRKGVGFFAKMKPAEHLIDPETINKSVAGTFGSTIKGKVPLGGIPSGTEINTKSISGKFLKGTSRQAANINAIAYGGEGMKGKNPLTRLPEFLGREFNAQKYFTAPEKATGGYTPVMKRGIIGRVAWPLIGTGVGMGTIEASLKHNDDNSPVTPAQRIRTGVVSSLKWGVAQPLLVGKYMAYDLPKAGFKILTNKNNSTNKE